MRKNKDIVADGYNQMGQSYHESRIRREEKVNPWLEEQFQTMPQTGSFLDVGCGGGRPVSKFFADKGFAVSGIDISSSMIELARASIPEGKFQVGDMETMDFPENTFDVISSFFAIIHVPREAHQMILEKIFSYLKPGGEFIATLGLNDNPEGYEEDWKGAPMYWSHFDGETNKKMLEAAGFVIELAEETGRPGDWHMYFRCRKL